MIVFDLLCASGHRFEGWFGSAAASVERVPSASRVNFGAAEPKSPPPKPQQPQQTPEMQGKDPFAIAQMLYSRMLDEMLTKSEDVGKEFPAEARKIYFQEAPARAIRGQATQEQHEELVEEGVPVVSPELLAQLERRR